MKVEGESWMLGQRGEYDGQYGKVLHSTAEQHLPFHRPKHFPARVPNWAVERQNQMGRGARSLDRSLFLPSWAKIPQPQPPFWVKRDGSKVAGNWQVPKQQQQSELQVERQQEQQFVQQQKSPSQQQKQQQQYVANQQIINSPQQKEEENRLPQPSPTQQQQQPSPQQKQKTQQIQKLPSPTDQKQPQKEETDKNLQKSKQQIFTQSQQSRPNYQQQTNVTTTTYTQNQQIQPPVNTQHTQPEQKPLHQGFTSAPTAQNQQQFTQLIITPSKTHQTTFKPAKQPLTSSQEQQQQLKQQQQYSDFYEGGGQTQKSGPQQEQFKQFTSPGGQFYGQQKAGNEWKAPQQQYIVNQTNQPSGQYYGRMPQQQQQQYQYRMQQQHPQLHKGGGYTKTPQNYPQGGIVEEEEKSGLENLAKMKLGKFPMRESLEAQQSLESNNEPVDSSNIKRQQFVRSGQPGQVIREEWRFSSGQPQKG
ncbi:unnamed protein product [Meloidogyne enterolobii]|uniref:Uncharacterized protein n=1 Tax=Meloidogyne enterolobii TaxID=390850 RepID=A0ACB0YGP5_MELEN